MLPVGVKVPVEGSYSSALARDARPQPPPAIKTFPSGSSVAVCPARGVVMLPTGVNAPGACANAAEVRENERTAMKNIRSLWTFRNIVRTRLQFHEYLAIMQISLNMGQYL